MAKTQPTPEEIEVARAVVAEADAAAAADRKAAVIEKLKPFTDAGWGAPLETSTLQVAIKALREKANTLAEIDPDLSNLLFAVSQPMATADDRLRSLVAVNAAAPTA